MGILSQSTATVRHFFPGNSGTPSHTQGLESPGRRALIKKLVVRTTGLVAIASLLGIASAADSAEQAQDSTNKNQQKAASIELTQDSAASAASPTTSGGAAVGGSTTNISSTKVTQSVTNGQSSVTATVDGQPIAVPDNGTNQQTITTPDASTTVTITNNSSDQGTNYNSNSTTIHRNSMRLDSSVTSSSERVDGAP